MAFTRPTLREIIERVKGDFKTGLSLPTILRRSFLDVFAKAFAAVSHTLHGHIDFGITRKFFPDTGDDETIIRWGTLFNVPRKDETFTELVIDVTGTTGGTLVVDKIYTRSDGILYNVKEEVAVPAATTVQATVVCQTAGLVGNMDDGDTLTLQSSVPGIESDALVNSTTVEGEDQESFDLYRERVLERMQFPPSGGTVNDYISFVKTVPGVTRAWVLPNNLGEGTVSVSFVEDDEDPIIPDQSKVDEVQEAVLPLVPVTADLFTFAPNEEQMNPEIKIKPNTTAVQNAVIAELEDLIAREAQVRGAADPDQVGLGVVFDGKIRLSQINEAISLAEGEVDHVLLDPTEDVEPPIGGLVTLGTPIFTTLP